MQQRVEVIDGLRALAILLVVMIHCGQAIPDLPAHVRSFTSFGGRGVQLFFIVSAFTLFSINQNREFSPRAFVLKRFFRIAPMFYLGILFYSFFPVYPHGTLWLPQDWLYVALTVCFLHGFSVVAINRVVPGGWSIADEVIFYAIFPWLRRTLTNLPRAGIALGIAVIISRLSFTLTPILAAGYAPELMLKQFAQFSFLTQLPAFIIGIFVVHLVAWLQENSMQRISKILVSPWCCGAIALTMLLCACANDSIVHNYLLVDVLLGALVLSAMLCRPRLLDNPVAGYVGRISYSIYLIHFAVIHFLGPWLMGMVADESPTARLLLLYGVTLLISIALASMSWRWIEQPMIALGHRLAARYKVRAAA